MNNRLTNNPITLSLELSQRVGSVALSNTLGRVVEKRIGTSCREEDEVIPSMKELAIDLGVAPKTIELVVVSIGPGGFTGLRTAVAIAKMVSLVTGAAIVPIETAISVAHHANKGSGPFFVVSGVKQDSFWLSKVQKEAEHWVCGAGVSTLTEMNKNLSNARAVFGDSYLPESVRTTCTANNVDIYNSSTSASSLLALGTQLYIEDNTASVDPLELVPLYPREPEAVRLWKNKRPSG